MEGFTKPEHEVAEVFRKYGQQYRLKYRMSYHTHRVINNIESCRTSIMGGHIDHCSNCDNKKISYNSCRNRHCPKCQGINQLSWVDDRGTDLLPVNHFHLVFTIPSELNQLTLFNKKLMYDLLLTSAKETILMLAKDKKYLGATPGIISVLHTWGQNLMDHPHVHVIVTGGGIDTKNGRKWVNSPKKFFLPVKVLSKVFRGKYLAELKSLYLKGILQFGSGIEYRNKRAFNTLLTTLYNKQWVVYAKKPFGNSFSVFKYLGKYTHRIAISNHRILNIKNGLVTFKWKDYSDKNQQKIMTLKAQEFIRRFLLHVLPNRFCKIRYSGILSSRFKSQKIKIARTDLNAKSPTKIEDKNWQDKLLRLTGFNVMKCDRCKLNSLQTIRILKQGVSP